MNVGPLRQRVVDAGLQRGALAEIERMLDDVGAGGAGDIGGVIPGAVVDHDDGVARALDVGHDARDHRPFVVGGDHHMRPASARQAPFRPSALRLSDTENSAAHEKVPRFSLRQEAAHRE